ncbi:MAG: collagen-like protein [Actinobacteria bacterium]|nr:collagen-like protein [Actinomycetota bacterium]
MSIPKDKIDKAILDGKIIDKTTASVFVMNEELKQEIDNKISDIKGKIDEAVKHIKESEINLPKVLESIKGNKGDKGEPGDKGDKGEPGLKGEKGDKGEPGLKGEKGNVGEQGIKGESGQDGLNGFNGKDGSPDTRLQIVEKINTGKIKDLKINIEQIDGLNKLVTTDNLNQAISILDQRTQFLINKQTGSGSGDLTKASVVLASIYAPEIPSGYLTTISASSTYVPYTGATTGVDLNAQHLININHLGVGTGTTEPDIVARFIGDNGTFSRFSMRGYSDNSGSSAIRVSKFRGTIALPAVPQSGDSLGMFQFAGYSGLTADGISGAYIEAKTTEVWTTTKNGTSLYFYVTATGTAGPALALTINQDKTAAFTSSVTGTQLISNIATGTAPLVVTSTTPVANLSIGGSAATLATPRAIYGNNFNGSADLTQVIASTYGGTGNGFTKFSGPATAEKTFTLPNASDTIGCLGTAGLWTANQTFAQAALLINNPAATFAYTFQSAAIAAARTITLPLLTGNDVMVTADFAQTLTNKRNVPRVLSATSYTTDTGTSLNCDTLDKFIITAQAGALKFNNPTGTPTSEQELTIKITDNGTARALTYDTQFVARGCPLPATTVLSKVLRIKFIWSAATSTWDCVSAAYEI